MREVSFQHRVRWMGLQAQRHPGQFRCRTAHLHVRRSRRVTTPDWSGQLGHSQMGECELELAYVQSGQRPVRGVAWFAATPPLLCFGPSLRGCRNVAEDTARLDERSISSWRCRTPEGSGEDGDLVHSRHRSSWLGAVLRPRPPHTGIVTCRLGFLRRWWQCTDRTPSPTTALRRCTHPSPGVQACPHRERTQSRLRWTTVAPELW